MSEQEDAKKYQKLVNRFINLANNMKAEGQDVQMIANALMTSCGVYSTYAAVKSNSGGLTEDGIKKVVEIFDYRLREVQAMRRAEVDQAARAQDADPKH